MKTELQEPGRPEAGQVWEFLQETLTAMEHGAGGEVDDLAGLAAAAVSSLLEFPPEDVVGSLQERGGPVKAMISWLVHTGRSLPRPAPERSDALASWWEKDAGDKLLTVPRPAA